MVTTTTLARRRHSKAFSAAAMMMMMMMMMLSMMMLATTAEASAPVPEKPEETAVEHDDHDDYDEDDSSKQEEYMPVTEGFRFVHKTVIIPHDEKKFRGGEDAASTTDTMLVVADGVGGWANRGVNPGLYSRKLTELVTAGYAAVPPGDRPGVDLKQLVHTANHAAADLHLGSATCTVVRLMDPATLETLNIGDSGYSIHRRYNRGSNRKKKDNNNNNGDGSPKNPLKVAYASVPGQKGFNFPYQLGGKYGDEVDGEGVADGPRRHSLHPKDIIVVVSDGVIDNIDPVRYHECLQRYLYWSDEHGDHDDHGGHGYWKDGDLVSMSAAADCIARKAYFLGKDKTHFGPFARSAQSYGKRYIGGKHDDITVTVAQVVVAGEDEPHGERRRPEDPHRSESIFLYKESDGPIRPEADLPTLADILGGDKPAVPAAGDDEL